MSPHGVWAAYDDLDTAIAIGEALGGSWSVEVISGPQPYRLWIYL